MMQLIGERYGMNPAKVGRIPNHARPVEYAEDLRGAARGEFDVSGGSILVAYSGTLAAWQMAEESTLLVAALQRLRPTTHMLFLTPDAVDESPQVPIFPKTRTVHYYAALMAIGLGTLYFRLDLGGCLAR